MKPRLLVVVLVFALAALACQSIGGLGSGDENPAPPLPDTGEQPDPDSAQPADSSDQAAGDTLPPGPETLNLDDPDLYVDILDTNYYTHFLFTFLGFAEGGSEVYGELEADGAYAVGPPPSSNFIVTAAGVTELDGADILKFTDTDNTDYVYMPTIGCLTFGNDEFDNPYDDFVDAGGDLTGTAQRVEIGVVVNGIVTDRYALTTENFNDDDFEPDEYIEIHEGNLYMSRDGYLIRLEVSGVGVSETLSGDPNLVGDITYQLDFEPTNDQIEIVPPEECNLTDQGAPESVYPILDDAANYSSLGTQFVSYTTNYPLAQIVEFYKTEMAALGYTLGSELVFQNNGILEFTKDGISVGVAITEAEGGGFTITIAGGE